MKRKGSAVWQGSLKEGKGTVSTESGALAEKPYSFTTRFGEEKGTNPEELIGAAHAGCFSMAFSAVLGEAGFTPTSIATTASVYIEKDDSGFSINKIDLDLTATIPGISEEVFQDLAGKAKAGCPVSKLFKGAEITLDAKLA